MPRAGKARCAFCGGPAAATVQQQKPSRKVDKKMAATYKPRPICMEQKCWEAYWNEEV